MSGSRVHSGESTVQLLGGRGLSQVGMKPGLNQERGMVKENGLHSD